MSFADLGLGALFAGPIALGAWRAHALTRGGAVAAFAVGTLTYGAGHVPATVVLLAFFVPSVLLSRLGRARKRALTDIGKGGPRDALQVLANGGPATAALVLGALAGGPATTAGFTAFAAFAASYAVATADTWATEIGTLARGTPRSILTLRPVARGLSGGVTFAGLTGSFAGALWIGLIGGVCLEAVYVPRPGDVYLGIPLFAVFGLVGFTTVGFAGALLDSLLGASLQELRRCPACERTCETNPHDCGTATVRVRGLPGASNDVVNVLTTAFGAIVVLGLALRGH